MPRWKLWKRSRSASPGQEFDGQATTQTSVRGFRLPPPRESRLSGLPSDPSTTSRLERHESLRRELDLAESAANDQSQWTNRVNEIDEAIESLDLELRAPVSRIDRPLPGLPEAPIVLVAIKPDAPSEIQLSVNEQALRFAEEIDWAERGTNIVRGELMLNDLDRQRLAEALPVEDRDRDLIETSLIELATAVRNATLEGTQPPDLPQLNQLLSPCPICGDLRLWNGVCLTCSQRSHLRQQLLEQRQRLFGERDSVIRERESLVEQLPILRKRVAESAKSLEKSE